MTIFFSEKISEILGIKPGVAWSGSKYANRCAMLPNLWFIFKDVLIIFFFCKRSSKYKVLSIQILNQSVVSDFAFFSCLLFSSRLWLIVEILAFCHFQTIFPMVERLSETINLVVVDLQLGCREVELSLSLSLAPTHTNKKGRTHFSQAFSLSLSFYHMNTHTHKLYFFANSSF